MQIAGEALARTSSRITARYKQFLIIQQAMADLQAPLPEETAEGESSLAAGDDQGKEDEGEDEEVRDRAEVDLELPLFRGMSEGEPGETDPSGEGGEPESPEEAPEEGETTEPESSSDHAMT
jgi:hypothetical protein